MIRLVIEKMSKGGFLVYEADSLGQPNYNCPPIHAATDIADALAFIGDNLAPVEKAHVGMMRNAAGDWHPIPETLGPLTPGAGECMCVMCIQARGVPEAKALGMAKAKADDDARRCAAGGSKMFCLRKHPHDRCKACPYVTPCEEPAADGSVNWDRASKFLHT